MKLPFKPSIGCMAAVEPDLSEVPLGGYGWIYGEQSCAFYKMVDDGAGNKHWVISGDAKPTVIVSGSRGWTNKDYINQVLKRVHPGLLHHGNAAGADKLAALEAHRLSIKVEEHPADWSKNGRKAGHVRNYEMIQNCCADLVLAFWDGRSTGTKSLLTMAKKVDIPILGVLPSGTLFCQEDISKSGKLSDEVQEEDFPYDPELRF